MLVALPATFAHAALRSPQVPVSGTALQSFFNAQGQAIDVNSAQQDAQRFSLPAFISFDVHVFGSSDVSSGAYNASVAVPPLYLLSPGAALNGWFVSVAFRESPIRMVVNLFDNNSAFVSTVTYLGADRTDLGFYDVGPGGVFYTQDARNPGGAPKILVFSGTGAGAGSTWFACETGAGPGGDFADAILLLGFATGPVPTSTTNWSRVKTLYH
jgi:hypothetical protein